MVLGPVADLAQGPNRTMAFRSFGEDPKRAAIYVQSTVGGMQTGGVSAVAKHFPGFGASTANSDEAVAYVDRSRDELLAQELAPFRAAIDASVDSIMVSHGIHRELGSTRPGTLDPAVATGLLRDELGFDGVAMTDSMNARGLREAWGDTVPRACPVAIAAGIDIVLLTGTIETARLCRVRIVEAVRDGSLPEERVREAAGRVIKLKQHRLSGASTTP
jgi:beta-N-acetylhexosaminidase